MLIGTYSDHEASLAASRRKLSATIVLIDHGHLKSVYCDTHYKKRFFRSWFIHNGQHMVYVNYSSKSDGHEAGVAEAERLVKSLRFLPLPTSFSSESPT